MLHIARPLRQSLCHHRKNFLHLLHRRPFRTGLGTMAQAHKLKDVTSLNFKDGEKREVEVEGIENGKVLLLGHQGKVHATSAKCTHYGAPLANGVVTSDGRLTCPWHGACFNVATGDVEDSPALDPIAKFDVYEEGGAVYIKGDAETIKAGRAKMNISCSPQGSEKVVVVGGGSGTIGTVEELRKNGFKGHITVISQEELPFDRPKLSKALLTDISKVAFRSADFYKSSSISIFQDEATGVDFNSNKVTTKSGKSFDYTKLVLATGGAPKALPLKGLKENELKNVFLLRSLNHTSAIVEALGQDSPKEVVVIGSSFIGMEVANCLANMKHKVNVIGMESAPTELVFGAEVGRIFQRLLERNGVSFFMNAQVSHAEPSGEDKSRVGSVHLKDGSSLPAEVVIEGVGVGPATRFLSSSSSAGVPDLHKDGSLGVDGNFSVKGVKDVYAVGDIATYPYKNHNVRIEHWNVAQNAGRQVARHILGKPVRDFTPVFWSALGMNLRYCGHPVGGYDDVIIKGETEVSQDKSPAFVAYYVKGDEVVAVATMGRDPIMVQCSELMRRGKMPSRKDIEGGFDVMSIMA